MKKIMFKIVVIAVISTVTTGLLVGLSLTYFIDNIFENQIQANKKQLYDNFDRVAKLEVNTAVSLLEKIKSMEDKGELKNEEAKELAKNIIRDLRYEEDGYYWIDDYDGNNVVLLGGKAEGKNRLELKDVKGKFLIKELLEKGRAGGGYTDYWFPKPGDTAASPKRGYSKAFEPYRWVVGTGNYVDDIEKINEEQRAMVEVEKASIRNKSLMILVATIFVMIIISIYFGKRISNPIVALTKASEELAKGVMIEDLNPNTKDEVYNLSQAFNLMKSKIVAVIKETEVLSKAAKEGKLDYRANSKNFEGSYKNILDGINEAIDNLIAPLNVTAEYVDRISKGDIPPKIIDDYKGDFNEIKNNINQCIDAINFLLKDTYAIVDSATAGLLSDRADSNKHLGDFRKVISGFNSTMDRLVGLIDNLPVPVQIVDKDFKILYLNKMAKEVNI